MDQRRVAEVHNPYRKSGGSGYLIGNNLILTAHHVIAPPDNTIPRPSYHIRFIGDYLQGRTEWIKEGCYLCWDDPKHDLALLQLQIDKPKFLSSQEPAIRFGKLGLGCNSLSAKGIGFPFVQEIENRQNPEELAGDLSWISGLKEKQLRLQVTSPIPNSPSQWQGISGTALFVKDLLVGVIVETNKSFAEKVLWATPISLVANSEEFCQLILDEPNGKIILQDVQPIKLSPFQAPPLPSYYVDRPEYSQDLKTRLLKESSDARTLVVTAIHGLGSVGKSTLAMALAHDRQVQTRFCDGILWATLGQQPNLLSLLSGWVQTLGYNDFKATSVEDTSNQLRTLLYNKAVLLVVDDAWNTGDAQAFNVGGARCQVLVTTRESSIAAALGVSTYNLDVMTPAQAMELLTRKLKNLGREIADAERQSAETLAKAVGYLPLALELAAAQVASGTTDWAVLLQDLKREIARLKTFDIPGAKDTTDEASLKRLSLTASLNLSVQRLAAEEKQNFTWLGVLPEDASITSKMTTTLWDLEDERDAFDTLEYLRSKALLLPSVPLADGTQTYRLHDLFHDLARNLLTSPPTPKRRGDLPGLGTTLAHAHATFLEKYRQKTQDGLWHTLPNDGYIHQHLVWHFEKAGQIEEIHQLFQEESPTGSNGWFEVREKLGQTRGYITDISRAWELAEANWSESTLPQVVGLQCRYALMIASVNSLTANVPLKLLVALVKNNFWTAEQGRVYALQNPDPSRKVKILAELVNYLPPNLEKLALSEALTAARAIEDKSIRVFALTDLVGKLPELLPEVLAAAEAMQNANFRASLFLTLAFSLPTELLPKLLEEAREIQDESFRFSFLYLLSNKLPELVPEAEVLAAMNAIQDERFKISMRVVFALADNKPELLAEALKEAREIQNEYNRISTLCYLADKLPELLPEALEAAKASQDENSRANALCYLADKLPPELLSEALAAARSIQNEYFRTIALSALVGKLPELLPEVLDVMRAMNENLRSDILSNLNDNLPSEWLSEALAVTRLIQDEYYRVSALCALADKLPELLPKALDTAKTIQNATHHVLALCALADKLPELLPEALNVAKMIQDKKYKASALSDVAIILPEAFPEALAALRAIKEDSNHPFALSTLITRKSETENLPEILSEAFETQNEFLHTFALVASNHNLRKVLPEVLAATKAIQDSSDRALILSALADKLPELLPEALAEARAIQDEEYRAFVLSTLIDKLPPELLLELLALAKTIQNESIRAKVLSALTNKLPPELLPEAREAAREIQSEEYRAEALSALAYQLPELLPEALAAARAIQHEYNRANALCTLVNQLPELLPEALAAARGLQREPCRNGLLEILALPLSEMPVTQLFPTWQQTLHELSLSTRENLLKNIEKLVPVIWRLGGQAAIVEVSCAIQDVGRWWY